MPDNTYSNPGLSRKCEYRKRKHSIAVPQSITNRKMKSYLLNMDSCAVSSGIRDPAGCVQVLKLPVAGRDSKTNYVRAGNLLLGVCSDCI